MLGVAVLIVVQSVMGGFGRTHREKIIEMDGHMRVISGRIIYDHTEILDQLRAKPEVVAATAYANGFVMLQHMNRPVFPAVRGLDFQSEQQVIPMEQFIRMGSIDDMDDDTVLISSTLANQVGAYIGSTVEIYTPLMLESLKNDEVLLPIELTVVGLFEVGVHQIDSSVIITTLRRMQDLYGLRGGVHGISVRLKENVDELAFTDSFQKELPPPYRAQSWMDQNEDFLWVLALEKNMMLFLLLFIVLVAAFAISIAQLLTVLRKTREIGLFGAMGARPSQLAAGYCFQGFFLGILGTGCGIALAMILLHYRNAVVRFLAELTQTEEALNRFYQFSELPVHYAREDFVVIITCTLILSTLAGLIPAWRAARLKPADALRTD